MIAMYECELQAPGALSLSFMLELIILAEYLGKVYGVISKRKGRIASEEMSDGTAFFRIKCYLPVCESFGVSDGTFLSFCTYLLTRFNRTTKTDIRYCQPAASFPWLRSVRYGSLLGANN